MNTAAQSIHSKILTVPAGASHPGRSGFAFMKVVEQTGAGTYKISLGGAVLEARSTMQLEPGSFLRVQLKSVAGQLQLVPEAAQPSGSSQHLFRFTEASFQSGTVPQQLAQIFASLGLPVDGISGRLFSMMQQLGLQFDGERLKRAYRLAKQFPGRESQAVEVALLLLEKGIEADSALVASVLSMMLGDENCFRSQNRGDGEGRRQEGDGSYGGLETLVEGLYGRSIASLGEHPGLMTLMNHIATGSLHWLVVPFSMDLGNTLQASSDSIPESTAEPTDSKSKTMVGTIRVLLNLDLKELVKIMVTGQSAASHYAFTVYYGKDGVERITFAPDSRRWKAELEGLFPGVSVSGGQMADMGLFCEPAQEFAGCNVEA